MVLKINWKQVARDAWESMENGMVYTYGMLEMQLEDNHVVVYDVEEKMYYDLDKHNKWLRIGKLAEWLMYYHGDY